MVVGLLFVLCLAVTGYGLLQGGGTATYTPHLYVEPLTVKNLPGFLAYTLFLFIPTILNVKEDILWHISRSKI